MSKNNAKIVALMESELGKNRGVATSDLYDMAKKLDASIGKLSLRQFHARYPLQIKRRQNRGRPSRKTKATAPRGRAKGGREGLRNVFLRFAEDLTAAEDRRDLVKVLANVDGYVDDAVKASRS
jgi:hypothetical protein